MYHRGYGDAILSKDKRLQYKWVWSRSASCCVKEELKKWTHFQISQAQVYDWKLSAVLWGSGDKITYEATIEYQDNHIASSRGKDFKTRIDAQIGAEKLLKGWIGKQHTLIMY